DSTRALGKVPFRLAKVARLAGRGVSDDAARPSPFPRLPWHWAHDCWKVSFPLVTAGEATGLAPARAGPVPETKQSTASRPMVTTVTTHRFGFITRSARQDVFLMKCTTFCPVVSE